MGKDLSVKSMHADMDVGGRAKQEHIAEDHIVAVNRHFYRYGAVVIFGFTNNDNVSGCLLVRSVHIANPPSCAALIFTAKGLFACRKLG
jgi:hypothetical protein